MTDRPEKPWDFDRWFVAQHGERPSREDSYRLRQRINEMRERLAVNQGLLEAIEMWDQRRTTALWAWQIKDSGKK